MSEMDACVNEVFDEFCLSLGHEQSSEKIGMPAISGAGSPCSSPLAKTIEKPQ
jgi:hypothetical protein